MTNVEQERKVSPWISSKCRENFCSFYFICIEGANRRSHCSTFLEKTFATYQKFSITTKLSSCLTLVIYGIMYILYSGLISKRIYFRIFQVSLPLQK